MGYKCMILSWFKKLFNVSNDEEFDTYKIDERMIYHYWDGEKFLHADPLILYRKLMDVGPELSIDIKVSESSCKEAPQAYTAVTKKICDIFAVRSYESQPSTQLDNFKSVGLTDVELRDLLDHFLIFCQHVKKNSKAQVTSLNSSEDSKTTSEQQSPPTINSSDSGSTEKECSTVEPTLST